MARILRGSHHGARPATSDPVYTHGSKYPAAARFGLQSNMEPAIFGRSMGDFPMGRARVLAIALTLYFPTLSVVAAQPVTPAPVDITKNQSHAQGFVGERLAAEALGNAGHTLISGLPKEMSDTTHPGGFDLVTMKDGFVYLIDNKAYSKTSEGQKIYGVSAFSDRRYQVNLYGKPDRLLTSRKNRLLT
jgi:hypothetical protein